MTFKTTARKVGIIEVHKYFRNAFGWKVPDIGVKMIFKDIDAIFAGLRCTEPGDGLAKTNKEFLWS